MIYIWTGTYAKKIEWEGHESLYGFWEFNEKHWLNLTLTMAKAVDRFAEKYPKFKKHLTIIDTFWIGKGHYNKLFGWNALWEYRRDE